MGGVTEAGGERKREAEVLGRRESRLHEKSETPISLIF